MRSIILTIALLLACASPAIDVRATASFFGDARRADLSATVQTNVAWLVKLPPGDFDAFTVTAWLRLVDLSGGSSITLYSFWCPDVIQRIRPDLAAEAFGCTNGITLAGTITITNFPWQRYPLGSASSNSWPKGCYNIVGWSSNAVQLSLGGITNTFGPGSFDRAMLPGSADSASLTGTGPARIGISQTPSHEFFSTAKREVGSSGETFSDNELVTNELVFCAWKIALNADHHLSCHALSGMSAYAPCTVITTNAMPAVSRSLSGSGYYRIGLWGRMISGTSFNVELFDARVFPRALSDIDLARIHANGVQEIARRQIPRWK